MHCARFSPINLQKLAEIHGPFGGFSALLNEENVAFVKLNFSYDRYHNVCSSGLVAPLPFDGRGSWGRYFNLYRFENVRQISLETFILLEDLSVLMAVVRVMICHQVD
jgi:hypothetical protein